MPSASKFLLPACILLTGLLAFSEKNEVLADGSLVTDISTHLISVESDFTGTDLLLFGAIRSDIAFEGKEGGDIIVVVRGPQRDVLVRKKERVAGIWVNTQSVELRKVPGFYASASNRPVEEITTPDTLDRLRIGPDRLVFHSEESKEKSRNFKQALIRQQENSELYTSDKTTDGQNARDHNRVFFLGASLFRTTIHFPANVPVGSYTAEFYLFRDMDLISAQSSPLFIKKFGIGRRIYDFAHTYPALHGIAAIIIALLAGWIASAIFRKD